jgi:hypothetical protein
MALGIKVLLIPGRGSCRLPAAIPDQTDKAHAEDAQQADHPGRLRDRLRTGASRLEVVDCVGTVHANREVVDVSVVGIAWTGDANLHGDAPTPSKTAVGDRCLGLAPL